MNLSRAYFFCDAVFFREPCEVVNAVFIPLGDLAFEEPARKLTASAAEKRAVLLAALEYFAFVLPHLNTFAAVFAAALTAAVIEKSALLAVPAAGGDF